MHFFYLLKQILDSFRKKSKWDKCFEILYISICFYSIFLIDSLAGYLMLEIIFFQILKALSYNFYYNIAVKKFEMILISNILCEIWFFSLGAFRILSIFPSEIPH